MGKWPSIPGETPIDISGLIPKRVTDRAELNIVEAENIRRAIVKYLAARPSGRQAPFTLPWTFKLHKEMFGRVWKWAGRRRQEDLNIGVAYQQIEVQLEELLRDLNYWRDHGVMPVAEQAVRLHHRAVQIHPFQNGNGRWGRLLANIWLRQMREAVTVWPEEVIGQTSIIRKEYIRAIRAADGGDYALLTGLHERYRERQEKS